MSSAGTEGGELGRGHVSTSDGLGSSRSSSPPSSCFSRPPFSAHWVQLSFDVFSCLLLCSLAPFSDGTNDLWYRVNGLF